MAGKVLSFNNGFAGQVSRSIDDIIESFANVDTAAIVFGAVVALKPDANGVTNLNGGTPVGIAARVAKTNDTYDKDDAKFNPREMVDVIKRGSVSVEVASGNPVMGGQVYVVKASGKIAAAADGDKTLAPAGWRFKTGKDGNGIAEIVLAERAY